MSDFDNITPYAVAEEETTTTTQEFPYSTTTEPPFPEYQYTATTLTLNSTNQSTNQSTHYIHFGSFEVTGNGYLEIENNGINADVTFDVHRDGYAKLKVTTMAPAIASSTIRLHCVNANGAENVIVFIINWKKNVEDIASVKIINNKRTFDYKAQKIELCYVACNINTNEHDPYTNAGWVTITKDSTYPIFYMNFERNDTNVDRTTLVNLAFAGDEMSATYYAEDSINVTQQKTTTIITSLVLSQTIAELPATATSITINYTISNGEITEIVSNKGWAIATKTSSTIKITTSRNTQNDRNATISIIWQSKEGVPQATRYIYLSQLTPVVNGSIDIEPISVDYHAHSGEVSYTARNVETSTIAVTTTSKWLSVSVYNSTNKIIYSVNENEGKARNAVVTIGFTSNGGGVGYKDFVITQNGGLEYLEFPIWQDTDITLTGDTDYISYRFIYNNEIVYNGKAYFIDGSATIRINDIIKDYLDEHIDLSIQDSIQDNNAYAVIKMQIENTYGDFTDYMMFRCYNDWSYSYGNNVILTKVINKTLDKRQLFILSVLDRFDDEPTTFYVSGVQDGSTRPYRRTFDIDSSISSIVLNCAYFNALYAGLDLNDQEEYIITNTCKPYCLYYRQRNGGYSWLLCNRGTKQTDSITNYEYTKQVNNTTIERGKTQYLKEYVEKWALKTDILSDIQSEIIQELLHSNEVYLHILDDDRIVPVNITDSTVEYKLKKNNARKPIVYTINVENSNLKHIK